MSIPNSPPQKTVAFTVESTVRQIEKPSKPKIRKRPNMTKQIFERFDGHELTDNMLDEAAQLFTENYGIWGEHPTSHGPIPKPGKSS